MEWQELDTITQSHAQDTCTSAMFYGSNHSKKDWRGIEWRRQ